MTAILTSWGNIAQFEGRVEPFDLAVFKETANATPRLPFGQLRSYGDSCLNTGYRMVDMNAHDNILFFDGRTGRIRVQSGCSFDELLRFLVPRGWFLPVTPGTKFVTAGGAAANDVHGKNHHQSGTFGNAVTVLELLRTDGERIVCSRKTNSELFSATIGGLGLTGVIIYLEFNCIPIRNGDIAGEALKFDCLDAFFEVSNDSGEYPYTVAWLDCLSRDKAGKAKVRGVFIRGEHAQNGGGLRLHPGKPKITVPVSVPGIFLNRWTMSLFNSAFYHKQMAPKKQFRQHYDPFFYPLDAIHCWNRCYGPRGFYQFQCALPDGKAKMVIQNILDRVAESGQGSFLSVLKTFGDTPSPGLLSFPIPGATLCLDFANKGEKTASLIRFLNKEVVEAGGRLYPAKDLLMTPWEFKNCYPEWKKFKSFADPGISSTFWRRVMEES